MDDLTSHFLKKREATRKKPSRSSHYHICLILYSITCSHSIVTVLNLLLTRSGRDEQALMVTIAGLITVLLLLVREISALFDLVRALFGF